MHSTQPIGKLSKSSITWYINELHDFIAEGHHEHGVQGGRQHNPDVEDCEKYFLKGAEDFACFYTCGIC